MFNSLDEDAAYSSIPKSERRGSEDSDKEALISVSRYQNAHSFYKEIKSEKNALFSSRGNLTLREFL
jgi:hypothetical protein